jgi:HEAT repeat protein
MEGLASPLSVALLAAVFSWLSVSVLAVVGRLSFERTHREPRVSGAPVGEARRRRNQRHAVSHRTRRGKWARIAALRTLVRTNDRRGSQFLHHALLSRDEDVVGAAVTLLGETGDDWAIRELVEALRRGVHPRSRIATQLDRLAPRPGPWLRYLLDDDQPAVRFWGATLLGRCPGVATERLIARTNDPDANVRAAAVEAVSKRREEKGLAAVRERLGDEAWFVRVHACRAVGQLGGLGSAPLVVPALRDAQWWVRSAAKDALRDLGPSVAGVLIPYLEDDDEFARNGAAEVLQDIGFVDALSSHGQEGALLRRIFAAGGAGLRRSALERASAAPAGDERSLEKAAS